MKPTKAIIASDNNPIYYPFWNIVSKYWNEVIGIEPVMIFVGEESPSTLGMNEKYGQIIHFDLKKNKMNFKTCTMAQTIRHFGATLFPDDVCILSDADMLPLSKEYFCKQDEVLSYDDNGICFYSSDTPGINGLNRFPMCYIAAKGHVFQEILQAKYQDFCRVFPQWVDRGYGWDTDEKVFYEKWKESRFVNNSLLLKRTWPNGLAKNRIDRVIINKIDWNNLEKYIDFHMLRPYSHNKNIFKILNKHYGV